MAQPIIQINRLNKIFKRQNGKTVQGLKDIDLTIEEGEFVSIIGTNGAGKSTLLNCLTGQLPISSGAILINGLSISKMSHPMIAKKIGRVFQDTSMGTAPRMTVFENLMIAKKRGQRRWLGVSLTKKNRIEIQKLLTEVKLDLEHRLDVPMENLSGGQRQVVSLIMATLQKPELLLLDEHTAALDPRTAKQVMEMTIDLVKTFGLTTLMITHQLSDALQYSDRIILMHRGQLKRILTRQEFENFSIGDLYTLTESLIYEN